jgi:hypothetical protein
MTGQPAGPVKEHPSRTNPPERHNRAAYRDRVDGGDGRRVRNDRRDGRAVGWWWARFVGRLRRRRYYVVVALVLATAAALALWAGSTSDGSLRDLSINLGADLVGTILAVFLIGPIIERAELRRDSVLERFDHPRFIRQVADAKHRVLILELWTDLLQGSYQAAFLSALRESLQRRVEVRMLLLSPDARAAEQRADDLLRQTNVVENIMDNLRTLHEFRRELPERYRSKLEIRIYSALPPVQMYRVDEHVIVSFYPVNVTSWNAAQYQTNPQAQLGTFVGTKFDELWEAASTRTLDQYRRVTLEVQGTDHRVRFIGTGDEVYVNGRELASGFLDRGIRGLRVRLVEENAKGERRERPEPYHLVPVEPGSEEYERAAEWFARKYGEDRAVVVLRLVTAGEP